MLGVLRLARACNWLNTTITTTIMCAAGTIITITTITITTITTNKLPTACTQCTAERAHSGQGACV
jgi:hypothetical protein